MLFRSAEVKSHGDGSHTVLFTPSEEGVHHVSVNVDGEEVESEDVVAVLPTGERLWCCGGVICGCEL